MTLLPFDELCDLLEAQYDTMRNNATEDNHLAVLDTLDMIAGEITTTWEEQRDDC